jgi:hypothetical protein
MPLSFDSFFDKLDKSLIKLDNNLSLSWLLLGFSIKYLTILIQILYCSNLLPPRG